MWKWEIGEWGRGAGQVIVLVGKADRMEWYEMIEESEHEHVHEHAYEV